MSRSATTIVSRLQQVHALRRARAADPTLLAGLRAVKRFQHARFLHDYAGLLASPRYGDAARFFLEQIYGPGDYEARDVELERVAPVMARMLPDDVMHTVAGLMELHALTEELDQQMAAALGPANLDDRSYRAAWLRVGRRPAREQQLSLLLLAGRELDRYTRSKVLAATLRVMRGPARAAGFGRLQAFLEAGMSAFASMGGASEFLRSIEDHETRVLDDFFTPK